MFQQTGCDGIMIGRAAISRPYIFREIANLVKSGMPQVAPQPEQVLEKMLEYLEDSLDTPKGAVELKTFCKYFAAGLPVPHWFWAPLQSVYDGRELAKRARSYFKK
jgi:tRNA-dihydrouridine synthase